MEKLLHCAASKSGQSSGDGISLELVLGVVGGIVFAIICVGLVLYLLRSNVKKVDDDQVAKRQNHGQEVELDTSSVFDFSVLGEPLKTDILTVAVTELNKYGFGPVTEKELETDIKNAFKSIAKPYRPQDAELIRLASLEVAMGEDHWETAAQCKHLCDWDYFLSHHKDGALLAPTIMKADLACGWRKSTTYTRPPRVFLDIDNLLDLSELLRAVASTRYFTFILTRDILSRPWCLAELYVALHSQTASVVPILLQQGDMRVRVTS